MSASLDRPVHAPLADAQLGRLRSTAARRSVLVAALLTVAKGLVGWWTGSLAVVASCLDSLLDLFASSVNWVALRTAEAPPDKEHPFGHGKAEYLGGLAQGIVIGLSGVYVLGEAMARMMSPRDIRNAGAGVAMMAVGVVSSAWLAGYLRAAARRSQSPALRADSVHYFTDVFTNAAALVALGAVIWTGSTVPDTVAAFVIAAFVLYSGFDVLRESIQGLMDRQLPDEEIERIVATVTGHHAVAGIHDLRARRAGSDRFVQLHVEMDGQMSFEAAHAVAEELTARIERMLVHAVVTVHADPVSVDETGRVVARPPVEPPLSGPDG